MLFGGACLGTLAALPALWAEVDLLRSCLLVAAGPALFWAVRESAVYCAAEPYLTPLWFRSRASRHVVLIPVNGSGTASSAELARARAEGAADVRALYIETDPLRTPEVQRRWAAASDVPLVVLEGGRSAGWTLLRYVESVRREPDDRIAVVLPAQLASLSLIAALFTRTQVLLAAPTSDRESLHTAG